MLTPEQKRRIREQNAELAAITEMSDEEVDQALRDMGVDPEEAVQKVNEAIDNAFKNFTRE